MNNLKATPVEIQWHSGLPIYASAPFLKLLGEQYGWVGGIDDAGRSTRADLVRGQRYYERPHAADRKPRRRSGRRPLRLEQKLDSDRLFEAVNQQGADRGQA